jgi:hypothetical protein
MLVDRFFYIQGIAVDKLGEGVYPELKAISLNTFQLMFNGILNHQYIKVDNQYYRKTEGIPREAIAPPS